MRMTDLTFDKGLYYFENLNLLNLRLYRLLSSRSHVQVVPRSPSQIYKPSFKSTTTFASFYRILLSNNLIYSALIQETRKSTGKISLLVGLIFIRNLNQKHHRKHR